MTLIDSICVPGATTMMLAAVKSRCRMPRSWAACSTPLKLTEQAPAAQRWQRSVFFDKRLESDALDKLHHQAKLLRIVRRSVEQGDRVAVLETGHHRILTHETSSKARVRRQMFVHHLDDHLAAAAALPGEVDFAHAAFAQQADRFVAAEEDLIFHACHFFLVSFLVSLVSKLLTRKLNSPTAASLKDVAKMV